MALKLQSRDLYFLLPTLNADATHQAYNALDSAVTLRVHHALQSRIEGDNSNTAHVAYHFTRAMQGPAMAMMRRGICINTKVRQDESSRIQAIRDKAAALLDRLADAVWGPEEYVKVEKRTEIYSPLGKRGQQLTPRIRTIRLETVATRPRGLNPGSGKQCLAFFNLALQRPVEYEIRKTPNGRERTPTANDKALRKWAAQRTRGPGISPRDGSVPPVRLAAPFVSLILTIRDCDKSLQVLRTPLDPDGRMRCSYNVAATENWRWSSSANAYGRGTNLQNITPTMRRMFCADDGYVMVSTDLEQAESYVVAGLVWEVTGNRDYLDAILSGDLHTQVCRMAWPELGWTDDAKSNRRVADEPYPQLGMSYRDVAKRIGHGSNYNGSAFGIAAAVGIPRDVVEDFQARYFRAFPAIRLWHEWVRRQILDHQHLDTPYTTRRWFFSRPWEDSTVREAIACVPQGTVALHLNLILYRCWERTLLPRDHERNLPIELLLQNHDAFLFQTKQTHDLPSLIASVNEEFTNAPIIFRRGTEELAVTIPGEFVTGWNWAYKEKDPNKGNWHFEDGNPDGLAKWGGREDRTRRGPARPSLGDWLGRPARSNWPR